MYAGTVTKVCVDGWWDGWLCKPILVFYFGPNQAFGLGLRMGPSQTILIYMIYCHIISNKNVLATIYAQTVVIKHKLAQ